MYLVPNSDYNACTKDALMISFLSKSYIENIQNVASYVKENDKNSILLIADRVNNCVINDS